MTIRISEEQLHGAAEIACEERGTEIEIRTDYSGRGMFGKTCYGFVADEFTLQVLELQLAISASLLGSEDDVLVDRNDLTEMFVEFGNMRCRDSMGLQTIYYYPRLEIVAEDEEG